MIHCEHTPWYAISRNAKAADDIVQTLQTPRLRCADIMRRTTNGEELKNALRAGFEFPWCEPMMVNFEEASDRPGPTTFCPL